MTWPPSLQRQERNLTAPHSQQNAPAPTNAVPRKNSHLLLRCNTEIPNFPKKPFQTTGCLQLERSSVLINSQPWVAPSSGRNSCGRRVPNLLLRFDLGASTSWGQSDNLAWNLVRAGGPHQLSVAIWLGTWCGPVARTSLLLQFGLELGAGWWPAPAFCYNLAWNLVWSGGPHQLAVTIWLGTWCGLVARTSFLLQFGLELGAGWWPAPAFCCNLAWNLVRAGGPHQLAVTIWLGTWPAPACCYNLAWNLVRAGGPHQLAVTIWLGTWCGLVARTSLLLQFGLELGAGWCPHQLAVTIWLGTWCGLVARTSLLLQFGLELGAGWWPAPACCYNLAWNLVRAGGPHQLAVTIWLGTWCGLVARTSLLLQFGLELGAGWWPAPACCYNLAWNLVRAGGPHQLAVTIWLGTWCGLVARTSVLLQFGLELGAGWWPAPACCYNLAWNLVRAGGPHQLAVTIWLGTWCGLVARTSLLLQFGLELGAGWWPAPACCYNLAWNLVRAGGPHQLAVTIWLGTWRGLVARTSLLLQFGLELGAGWWPAPACCYNLAWNLVRAGGPHQLAVTIWLGTWCGLVARTSLLLQFGLELGAGWWPAPACCYNLAWNLVRAGGPHQLAVTIWLGTWCGLVARTSLLLQFGLELGAGWWPAPACCYNLAWNLVRAGGPHQLAVTIWLGTWCGLVARTSLLLQFGLELGAGWWPAPACCYNLAWNLVRAGGPHQLAVTIWLGTWCGLVARTSLLLQFGLELGAGWWPAPACCYNLAWNLVRAGGPHQLAVTIWLGTWCGLVARTSLLLQFGLELGAGWWPAPACCYNLAWNLVRAGGGTWSGLVARTSLLLQFGLELGAGWWPAPAFCYNLAWNLVRPGGPHQLAVTIWLGTWCGLVARTSFVFQFGLELGAGWWPAPAFCYNLAWNLVRAGGPHQLAVTIWLGTWCGRTSFVLQFGLELGPGWWPAPACCYNFWLGEGWPAPALCFNLAWNLLRAGGPHQLAVTTWLELAGAGWQSSVTIWLGTWELGAGWWPAPACCYNLA